VTLVRKVAVSDLCLPVIPKRRSGQLVTSNNNPERSNDPVGRIVVNGAHNADDLACGLLELRSQASCDEHPGIERIAIAQNRRAMASRSIRSDEQIGTTLPL
jgi:hypothetical protein